MDRAELLDVLGRAMREHKGANGPPQVHIHINGPIIIGDTLAATTILRHLSKTPPEPEVPLKKTAAR